MPSFEYSALDDGGTSRKGIIEADSERHARAQLREQKLLPVSLQTSKRKSRSGGKVKGVGIRDVTLFTRQFATLIQSAIPIDEALQATAKQARKAGMQHLVLGVRAKVLEGHNLADSLREYPSVFKPVYTALVASGEKSGDLAEVLSRLADYTEESQRLRSVVVQALVYPAVLLAVSLGVIAILMTFVVPKVVSQFDQVGASLPLLTRIMVGTSEVLQSSWYLIIIAAIALWSATRWWLSDPERQCNWHRREIRLPVVGELLLTLDSARFLQTLAILLHSGVPLVESIRVAARTMRNLHMQQRLLAVSGEVNEGKSFSLALQQDALLPMIAIYMISSGERSGELADMVRRSAVSIEADTTDRVQMFISLFEPTIIVILGVIVMLIVLAILMPILQLNSFVSL